MFLAKHNRNSPLKSQKHSHIQRIINNAVVAHLRIVFAQDNTLVKFSLYFADNQKFSVIFLNPFVQKIVKRVGVFVCLSQFVNNVRRYIFCPHSSNLSVIFLFSIRTSCFKEKILYHHSFSQGQKNKKHNFSQLKIRQNLNFSQCKTVCFSTFSNVLFSQIRSVAVHFTHSYVFRSNFDHFFIANPVYAVFQSHNSVRS